MHALYFSMRALLFCVNFPNFAFEKNILLKIIQFQYKNFKNNTNWSQVICVAK